MSWLAHCFANLFWLTYINTWKNYIFKNAMHLNIIKRMSALLRVAKNIQWNTFSWPLSQILKILRYVSTCLDTHPWTLYILTGYKNIRSMFITRVRYNPLFWKIQVISNQFISLPLNYQFSNWLSKDKFLGHNHVSAILYFYVLSKG